MDFFDYLFYGFMIFLGLFIGLIFLAFVTDLFLSMSHGIATIQQGNSNTTVWLKSYEEGKDGCIEYVDVWGSKGRTCGDYQFKKFK